MGLWHLTAASFEVRSMLSSCSLAQGFHLPILAETHRFYYLTVSPFHHTVGLNN
jgi:hypothetical protein